MRGVTVRTIVWLTSVVSMDSGTLALLALLIGAVFGVGVSLLLVFAAHHGRRAAEVTNPVVPDGVDQILDELETAALVLDPSNYVLKASPSAITSGLVWNHAVTSPEILEIIVQARSTGETVMRSIEVTRGRFGESTVHLDVKATALGSRYLLVLADDRTETYRIEEVRRDFVANVSHELKTPIGAISLLAEALETGADDPQMVRRFSKRLIKEAERLGRITREIIDLSRLQFKDALRDVARVSIDRVIATALDATQVAAEAQDIQLVRGGVTGTEVWGDESMLTAAIQNLIENAIAYSPKHSRVGIGVSRVDGAIEIAVTDQGVGIPEEELARVFERFYRVDQSRARHTGGSGLGLSIVKHVAGNHGGDVRVWSQLGRGSTFILRIPEAPSETESADIS